MSIQARGRNDDAVVFMDEVVFDFSFLKKYKVRHKKKATLLLSLAKNGILLKPLIVLCSSIESDKETVISDSASAVLDHTESGDAEDRALVKWADECLLTYLNGLSCLLLLDSIQLHRAGKFLSHLARHSVRVMYLPRGVGCILNPLKDVVPLLANLVMENAKESDCVNKRHTRVKQNIVLKWIMDNLNKLVTDHSSLLYSAFHCFK